MNVDVQFDAPRRSPEGLPEYEVGQMVRGTLTCRPDHDQHTRGVLLSLGCHIHGSGTPEDVEALPEEVIYQGDLTAGQIITHSFAAQLPPDGPLSYQGRRVKFDWAVRLRIDIPVWPDQRLAFPLVVVPRRAAADAAGAEATASVWDDDQA